MKAIPDDDTRMLDFHGQNRASALAGAVVPTGYVIDREVEVTKPRSGFFGRGHSDGTWRWILSKRNGWSFWQSRVKQIAATVQADPLFTHATRAVPRERQMREYLDVAKNSAWPSCLAGVTLGITLARGDMMYGGGISLSMDKALEFKHVCELEDEITEILHTKEDGAIDDNAPIGPKPTDQVSPVASSVPQQGAVEEKSLLLTGIRSWLQVADEKDSTALTASQLMLEMVGVEFLANEQCVDQLAQAFVLLDNHAQEMGRDFAIFMGCLVSALYGGQWRRTSDDSYVLSEVGPKRATIDIVKDILPIIRRDGSASFQHLFRDIKSRGGL